MAAIDKFLAKWLPTRAQQVFGCFGVYSAMFGLPAMMKPWPVPQIPEEKVAASAAPTTGGGAFSTLTIDNVGEWMENENNMKAFEAYIEKGDFNISE